MDDQSSYISREGTPVSAQEAYPGPSLRDWALSAFSVVFTLGGLSSLGSDLAYGLLCAGFFGPIAVAQIYLLIQKLRRHRTAPLAVKLVGGVPIRQSRWLLLAAGMWLVPLGGIVVWAARLSDSILLAGCAVPVMAAGLWLLFGVVTGRLPNGYWQPDPAGLTFGGRRWRYWVDWDNIAALGHGILQSNPALLIKILDPDRVRVAPQDDTDRVLRLWGKNSRLTGAEIILFPMQYGMDLFLLHQALDRYIRDPQARRELQQRQINHRL